MTRKKTISLFVILIILIIGIIFAYYFFIGDGKSTLIDKTPKTEQGETITRPASTKNLVQMTDEAIISPAINEDKNLMKYITRNSGFLYTSSLDGKNKTKEPFVTLSGLIKILWSPDQEKFINIYADSFGVKRFYYNLKEKNTTPLNKNMNWVVYSKTKDKIAYHYQDPSQNTNTIAISNPDGTSSQSILNTRIKDIRLEWVTDDKIAVSTAPSGLSENILYYTKVSKPKFIRIFSGINGLTSLWSNDGKKILFSQTDENGNNVHLFSANENGLDIKDTGLKTLPEKCIFSKDNINIFCAEPISIPDNTIMPDDYYKKTFSVNDVIWKINLETGKKDLLYQFQEDIDFDVVDMTLVKDEKIIFFINRSNGFLYRLEL
jgi:hypothetical protein